MTGIKEIFDAVKNVGEANEVFRSKVNGDVADLRDRVENMEARGEMVGGGARLPNGVTREMVEHKELCVAWIRNHRDHDANQKLTNIQNHLVSRKAVSIGTPTGGGYAVPELIARDINRLEKKFKDVNGQYLWQPSTTAGQPDRLLGYPVAIWEDLDDVGTNKLPVAFGDFRRAYTVADRGQMEITVDQVTAVGFTKFYVRRRVSGLVTNNDAVKFLKATLS
jgi:predicted phage gp36 major capsid-like protein